MREGGDDGWREMLEVESKSYVNNHIPLTLNYSPTQSHTCIHMYMNIHINDTHADSYCLTFPPVCPRTAKEKRVDCSEFPGILN